MNPTLPYPESPESQLVKVRRLRVTFDRPEMLEKIASVLLSDGLISGYKNGPVDAGYLHKSKKVQEGQHELRIFLPKDAQVGSVREYIFTEIRKYWDVPDIEEDEVEVPAAMLHFIQKAGDEQRKYMGAKRANRIIVWASAALLGISGLLLSKFYSDASYAEGQVEG